MFRGSRLLLSLCFGILFLVFGIAALPNYGPNWDEPVHFGRGQAILHYFLTGKKDYSELSPEQLLRKSYYQHEGYTYAFFEQKFDETKMFLAGTGHPVVSDILSAIFNRIFYQTLHVIGDIESYHLYSVTLAAILVGVAYFYTSLHYGSFAGLISVLSLALTPFFLGESRFNIKDIPETVFYSITILTAYSGIINNDWKWIVASSLFAGFAFGTKLNIVFGIFTLVIWILMLFVEEIRHVGFKKFVRARRYILLSFFAYPILSLALYFGSWPILWKDPIGRFIYNLNYYKTIGTTGIGSNEFTTFFGINTYAIQWIIFTTPVVVLLLASIGIVAGGWTRKNRPFFFLVVMWFLVPIIRVSLPRMAIYGGNRQILEYIPAMAILAGIGARSAIRSCNAFKKRRRLVTLAVHMVAVFSFIPITVKIISMHPNESIYFNLLIGGLKGAADRNLPGWGNSLGSTYRQGVRWLNSNAEKGARVGFIYELRSNIPEIDLRSDFEFSNQVRTAIQRKGEYIIGVTHEGTQEYAYHRKYLERFLDPVYTVTVDGVPVLKVWKNDVEHSKSEYKKSEETVQNFSVFEKNNTLIIDLRQERRVTKVTIRYPVTESCMTLAKGYFQHSKNGTKWVRETADIMFFPLAYWFTTQPEPGVLQFLFAAEPARYIQLTDLDKNSCLLRQPLQTQVNAL